MARGQKKGFRHSETTKNQISETCKKRGIGKWMLGKKLSKSWRKNIAKASSLRKLPESAKQKLSHERMGKGNPQWKGGKKIDQGYIWIYMPKHPFSNKRYIKRSRLIMEKYLGRYLKKGEIIHHINGIKTDDRIKNLELLINRSKHMSIHRPNLPPRGRKVQI